MTNPWVKRIVLLTLFGAAAAGFAYSMRPKPVAVDIAVVDRGPIEVTLTEEGMTRIRDVYQVFAPIGGRIDRSPLDVGDPMRRGVTVIAEIHPVPPPFQDERLRREILAHVDATRAAVGLAKAEVQRAMSDYRLATSDLNRAERLYQRGVLAGKAYDTAVAEAEAKKAILKQAVAKLKMQQSESDSAAARLIQPGEVDNPHSGDCCVSVYAPYDGVALDIAAKSEQVIAQGALLAEIGDPDDLEIVVDFLSSDAVRIDVGTQARISNWGGSDILEARVRRIDPIGFTKVSALGIEEQRVNVIFDLVASPAAYDRLDHAYRVLVNVILEEVEDAVRIPLGALFRQGDEWSVFRIEDGIARLMPLVLGVRNSDHARVLSGLKEGTSVILYPSDRISDGTPVERRVDG